MIRLPPISTRTYTLLPYTTLVRSVADHDIEHAGGRAGLEQQFGQAQRAGRILLRRFQHEGIAAGDRHREHPHRRSEEHTSELQSLMRISYAVFCLKKKTQKTLKQSTNTIQE